MNRLINQILPLLFLLLLISCNENDKNNGKNIIIENNDFSLVISSDGSAISLKHKPTGQECLQPGVKMPAFALTQNRPYDNELQLSYPSKPKTFGADTVYRDGEDLVVGFRPERNIARIGVKITENYIAFTLKSFDYDLNDLRVKRKTEIDEFTILQLPVADRKNFGEWLNVSWDDKVAVNLLGTGPETKIDAEKREDFRIFKAGADAEVKMEGVSAALIVTSQKDLLQRISVVEKDFNIPNGVISRLSKEYKYSYYEASRINLNNVDQHIDYARKGGFRAFMIHYFAFSQSLGHFPWLPEYPNGIEDLKAIVNKITDAGMVPGFHIHYSKVMNNDAYVTPVPDPRLNLSRNFTLSAAIDIQDSVVMVEENPAGCTLEGGRRVLKIGNELIEFKKYTTSRPYCFTGCKRGIMGTSVSKYDAGYKFGLLDVDTWTIFVRVDQRTSLQQELAQKIADIANQSGFRFIYFDGAEDVHPPYWYNIGNSQYEVYKRFSPEIMFAEGAAKAHFSWHILTRGNAFDVFKAELFKQAIKTYQAPEARFVANDFSSINFGWIEPFFPDKNTVGIQPDMFEYAWSRAAAWDCPVSLNGKIPLLDQHPRTADNLEAIRRWEDARLKGYLTQEMKEQLKDLDQEHTMLIEQNGNYEIQPCRQITGMPLDSAAIRSFVFERNGKTWIAYWHTYGDSRINLNLDADKIRLFENPGNEIQFKTGEKGVILPAGKKLYLETSLSAGEIEKAFKTLVIK